MKLEDVPAGMTQCPRCTGCGYGDHAPDDPDFCATCAVDVIAVKRPGCHVCGGTGIRACNVDRHEHGHADAPCATQAQAPGEVCYSCDQIIPDPDDGHGCWEPIETVADGKAVFAELGFDTVIIPREQ